MFNFIPTSFSNKLTPGSPECLVSTERAVNLRINIALIKACIGAAMPIIIYKERPGNSPDGKDLLYRGSFDSQTGSAFGRGVAYEGSWLFPKSVQIGRFETNGSLKEGYFYEKKETGTIHAAHSSKSRVVNIMTSKGEYVRGVVPKPNNTSALPNLQHMKIFQKTDEGLPLPIQGGEIFGTCSGIFYKGTFQPDGTFTGSISMPSGGPLLEGVFLFQISADNQINFNQISGTYTHRDIEGEMTFTCKISSNEGQREGKVFEGRETYSNGSFREGLFAYEDSPCGKERIRRHLSGPVELNDDDNSSLKGKMLDKNTFEGRETLPNGSFREGLFRFHATGILTQLSGNFEQRNKDGSIYTGKILNEKTFEGQMIFPNGAFKTGIFLMDPSLAKTGFFETQISGTFKKIQKNGEVLEGEILGDDNKWKGSHTYPNGSVRNGVFGITEKDRNVSRISFLSGTCKIIEEDGSILEGVINEGGEGTGTFTMPDKQCVRVTHDPIEEQWRIVPDMTERKLNSIEAFIEWIVQLVYKYCFPWFWQDIETNSKKQ